MICFEVAHVFKGFYSESACNPVNDMWDAQNFS